jgi:hypothetical protein
MDSYMYPESGSEYCCFPSISNTDIIHDVDHIYVTVIYIVTNKYLISTAWLSLEPDVIIIGHWSIRKYVKPGLSLFILTTELRPPQVLMKDEGRWKVLIRVRVEYHSTLQPPPITLWLTGGVTFAYAAARPPSPAFSADFFLWSVTPSTLLPRHCTTRH